MRVAKSEFSFEECRERAAESLQSGAAFEVFSKLINRRDAETQRENK
jgi:thymidine phosphorylase